MALDNRQRSIEKMLIRAVYTQQQPERGGSINIFHATMHSASMLLVSIHLSIAKVLII